MFLQVCLFVCLYFDLVQKGGEKKNLKTPVYRGT